MDEKQRAGAPELAPELQGVPREVKPLAVVLMDLVEGRCPACAGDDLHSAARNGDEAVSCTACGWFATYRSLRERVSAMPVVVLEVALAESLKLQSHYAVLLNHHDGGTRLIFPTVDAWLDRLAGLHPGRPGVAPPSPAVRAGQAALASAGAIVARMAVPAEERRSQNLVQALQAEVGRVRDEVLPAYVEIGSAGTWALGCMREDIRLAEAAIGEGDAVAMLHRLAALREYHT